MRSTIYAAVTLSLALAAAPEASAREDATLYLRTAFSDAGTFTADYETAVGSREARPFGDAGLEEGARLRYRPIPRLCLEGWGGLLFTGEGLAAGAAALEAHLGVLDQAAGRPLSITDERGMLRDYQGVWVPRARLTLDRSQGLWDLALSGLAEVPLAEERDEVDLIVALSALRQVGPGAWVGGELLGEDLEGFWEEDEAEGGAKLVVGPTGWIPLGEHLHLKANVGAIIPATWNVPTRVVDGVTVPNEPGLLARLAAGATF